MSTSITVHLKEWEKRTPGAFPDDPLVGIRLTSEADRALVARLAREGVLIARELAQGLEIETTSYVGKVRLGPLTLTITAKLGHEPFARLFRYAYGLRDLRRMPSAPFSDDGSLFEDLLPSQLLAEAQELLSRGLDRRYVAVDEPLSSPRGRINMSRIAREGGVLRGSLPCRHHLRLPDCSLNQVLLGGLRLATGMALNPALKSELHQLADVLAVSVRTRPLHRQLVAQTAQGLDRMASAYAPALTIIGLLLEGEAPALEDSDEPLILPGFLLDMNRFFQRLLGRFLGENLDDCQVMEERSLNDLMRYASDENPRRRRAPRPRPDFAVKAPGRQLLLLDAKYRDLWARELPREMLYQLAIYALSQPHGGRATILYPTTADEASPARIEIREPMGGWGRASIALQPVHLGALDRMIAGRQACEQARRELAREIVFGPTHSKQVQSAPSPHV